MAKFTDKSAFVLPRHIRLKNGINAVTLDENLVTLDHDDSSIQVCTCDGASASTLKLPPHKNGLIYAVSNVAGSSQSLNINDPSSGATIVSLSAGEGALIACDGDAYYSVIKA